MVGLFGGRPADDEVRSDAGAVLPSGVVRSDCSRSGELINCQLLLLSDDERKEERCKSVALTQELRSLLPL